MANKVKYVEMDPAEIYLTHMRAINFANSFNELRAVHTAGIYSIKKVLLRAQFATAVRVKRDGLHKLICDCGHVEQH